MADITGYMWSDARTTLAHAYLLPLVEALLEDAAKANRRRLFDLGCGNGSVANWLCAKGWDVTGVDPSAAGLGQAKACYPNMKLYIGSAYDDLQATFGQFPCVISLEVVEHLYAPREYARTLFSVVEPGGFAVVSTPYHGYWKNLALALTGQFDKHFTALWDHGHIKFWSVATLTALLEEAGFTNLEVYRAGRIPCLAKSMVVRAYRERT